MREAAFSANGLFPGGAGGVDFAVLGEVLNREFTFWNEKETFFRSDTCP
jgi:hypothetical protein